MTPLAAAPAGLPPRRLNLTSVITWLERHEWLATIGFGRDGHAREVFLQGIKTGTDLDETAADLCILLSYLLQEGGFDAGALLRKLATPDEIQRWLNPDAAVVPIGGPGQYAPSLVRQLLVHLLLGERERGETIAMAYASADRRKPTGGKT